MTGEGDPGSNPRTFHAGFVADKKNKRIIARRVGRGSIPGQFIWDLWWTKWHWDSFCF